MGWFRKRRRLNLLSAGLHSHHQRKETCLTPRHRLPVLVKAALAHVQFESIHPFLDGNGRLGRLLIPLILCVDGAIRSPLLYLSLYFKTHRKLYYDHLTLVRETGDWEEWIAFFLKGIVQTADQATETARRITALFHACIRCWRSSHTLACGPNGGSA